MRDEGWRSESRVQSFPILEFPDIVMIKKRAQGQLGHMIRSSSIPNGDFPSWSNWRWSSDIWGSELRTSEFGASELGVWDLLSRSFATWQFTKETSTRRAQTRASSEILIMEVWSFGSLELGVQHFLS